MKYWPVDYGLFMSALRNTRILKENEEGTRQKITKHLKKCSFTKEQLEQVWLLFSTRIWTRDTRATTSPLHGLDPRYAKKDDGSTQRLRPRHIREKVAKTKPLQKGESAV